MQEVTLMDGTVVQTERVTYFAIQHILGQCPICQMPPIPVEEIPGKAGVTQAPARPGTPQYAEYEQKRQKVMEMRRQVEDDARLYLGILGWKLPGDKSFHQRVPKGWEFPPRLKMLGVVSYQEALSESGMADAGRIWDYILFGLLKNNRDIAAVTNTLYVPPDEEDVVEDEEVKAMAELFPGDEEQEADTGSA